MVTEITRGVRVSVESFYQDDYSNPLDSEFIFAYRVTIENSSESTIRLLRRHWFIYDAYGTGEYREVEGDGVVGQQPTLDPMAQYQYVSGCNLKSELGRMHGVYEFERISDGRIFEVLIPEFELIATPKLN